MAEEKDSKGLIYKNFFTGERSIGDLVTDSFFSAFPALKTGLEVLKTIDTSITEAREARAFDQSIKEKVRDLQGNEFKLTTADLTVPLEGFVGTPEQELAHKIKLQTENFTDVNIDVTDASQANLNKAIALMGSEKDINKKISAALAVTAITTQMSVLNMNNYTTQARAAVGLDDLERQIQQGIASEMRSPFNPGNGTHSIEVQTLIDKRAALNINLPRLAQEYASMDPAIAAPLAAATALLKTLPIAERLEMARERMQAKVADINTITDTEAKNYAMMTGRYNSIDWNSPNEIFKAKSSFYIDKEFQKLSQQHLLSIDDPLTARTLFAFTDSPIDKSRNFAIMHRIEADSLNIQEPTISSAERQRRISKLDENMKLVKAVYASDLPKAVQNSINTQINVEMSGASTKEKDVRRKELETAQKDTLLQQVLINRFTSDVTQWKGMDTINPIVQQTITNVRKTTGKQTVPLEAFVSEFLSVPSDLTYRQKLKQLQAIIFSSANVANDSAILPEISGEEIYNKAAPGTARIWLNNITGGVRG